MKFKIHLLATLLLVNLLFILVSPVLAEDKISKSTINPDSLLYSLDRFLEKLLYNIQFSSTSKVNFHKSLLEERFAELDYIASNKLLGQFETSSKRFAAQAGTLVEFMKNSNVEDDKEDIKKRLKEYREYLPRLRDKYEANSSYWMLIQQDIDSLNLYLEKLK